MAGEWRPSSPVVLVLRLPMPDALWLAGVAAMAGVRCFEVTATESDFRETFVELQRQLPDAELGVGSLRASDEVRAAAELGAAFAVSPVAVPGGSSAAHDAGIAFIEGAATPTEVHDARRRGADIVKVFPAGALGGPRYVRDVLAPLPEVPLMPSGGVPASDVPSYLAAGAVAVGLGSSVASREELVHRHVEPVLERLNGLLLG